MPDRGGFELFARISPDLLEFGENGPYLGAGVRNMRPAGSVVDRIESSGNFDISQIIPGPPQGASVVGLRRLR